MALTKEQKNKEEISIFLQFNNIDPKNAMGYNKFETTYYVGEKRMFREEMPIIFNIFGNSDINVVLPEINDIEFETALKTSEQDFHFDEEYETLIITSKESLKHNQEYKIVVSSIYLDFLEQQRL